MIVGGYRLSRNVRTSSDDDDNNDGDDDADGDDDGDDEDDDEDDDLGKCRIAVRPSIPPFPLRSPTNDDPPETITAAPSDVASTTAENRGEGQQHHLYLRFPFVHPLVGNSDFGFRFPGTAGIRNSASEFGIPELSGGNSNRKT
jgi:hypothetical protein